VTWSEFTAGESSSHLPGAVGGVERGAQRGSKAAGEMETGFHSPYCPTLKKLGRSGDGRVLGAFPTRVSLFQSVLSEPGGMGS